MKYDYIRYIKERLESLSKNLLLDDILKIMLDKNFSYLINGLDGNNKIILDGYNENDINFVKMYNNEALEKFSKVDFKNNCSESMIELLYEKENNLYYSRCEEAKGENGYFFTATTARLVKDQKVNEIFADDIKSGVYFYDKKALDIIDNKYFSFLEDGVILDNSYDMYEKFENVQNKLYAKYILPDSYYLIDAAKQNNTEYVVNSAIMISPHAINSNFISDLACLNEMTLGDKISFKNFQKYVKMPNIKLVGHCFYTSTENFYNDRSCIRDEATIKNNELVKKF